MADMLSRARFDDEGGMVYVATGRRGTPTLIDFHESKYEGEWLQIGGFLKTMTPDAAYRIPMEAPEEEGRHTAPGGGDSPWAGHRGTWATFEKIKGKFWWPGLYRDVHRFVTTCESCQMHSVVRHRDELHPTVHFKWMVDLVTMPMGVGQIRYSVLAREDLTNQVEGRALQNKTTVAVCWFLIEDVICRYGCVGKIVADHGELDVEEAEELFGRLGVKMSLTTAYNPEANGKVERGHGPIVKALVRACGGEVGNWPRLLPYALWADRTTHSSVTGYMSAELIFGQKTIMPMERRQWTGEMR